MRSSFTISTAASSKNLTTRSRAKTLLNITSGDDDAYLDLVIPQVSSLICTYLGVARANDGTMTLGQETVVETIRLDRDMKELVLSRQPVSSISQVLEDDDAVADALESDEYEVDAAGLLRRMDGDDHESIWTAWKVRVTYVAGWVLPGDSGTITLPEEIEEAAIELIKLARTARTRDPLVKSETVDGVGRQDFWVGGIGEGSLPPNITMKIDAYRNDYFP